MHTPTENFIHIPAVGSQPAREMDPNNRTQLQSLIEIATAHFECAAQYWICGNNSGDDATVARMEEACQKARNKSEALLKPLGITCRYPGLYPAFEVADVTEYTVRNAVLTATGHPRNFLPL